MEHSLSAINLENSALHDIVAGHDLTIFRVWVDFLVPRAFDMPAVAIGRGPALRCLGLPAVVHVAVEPLWKEVVNEGAVLAAGRCREARKV